MEALITMFLTGGLNKKNSTGPATPQQREISAELQQMIKLLREAKGGGVSQEFAKKLKILDDNRAEIENGIVAWVKLVEVIVQGAEQRYPDGHGARKKAQVRAALYQIVSGEDFEIPKVPRYLQPVIMEIVVDWFVEVIVANANEYELWDSREPDKGWMGSIWALLGMAMKLLLAPLAEIFSWIYVKVRYSEPLTPELEAAVQQVKDTRLISNKRELLGSPTDLITFVAEHSQQIAAGTRLFFEVVHQAERFVSLSGPDKKAYARNVILDVLDELGFPVGGGLFGAIVTAFIDSGIESAWSIFNKRAPEAFRHRRRELAST
jgi:hypothetical protein